MEAGALSSAAPLAAITLALTFALNVFDRALKRWKVGHVRNIIRGVADAHDQVPETRRQQFELQQEVAHLQRQAAVLNHPDTFAQCAKVERKAIALEKELVKLRQEQAEAGAQRLRHLPQLLRILLLLWLAHLSTKVPVVGCLRPEAVWPLGRWLSVGAGKAGTPGAVGLLAWGMLCQRLSVALLGRS